MLEGLKRGENGDRTTGVYAQEKFGMSLPEFMKQKIEVEDLYNYEIARLLEIKKRDVGRLIKRLGIKKDGFNIRFETIYGMGAIYLFKQLIACPKHSLSYVGRHFGFSREYARYVYEMIYGYPYTETLKKKRFEKIKARNKAYREPKKLQYLRQLIERMISLGLTPDIGEKKQAYRLYLNGYKIGFRYCEKPFVDDVNMKLYFRITYPNGLNSSLDFTICLCRYKNECTYYIVPQDYMPRTGICFLPKAKPHESKYDKFREAWDLLIH